MCVCSNACILPGKAVPEMAYNVSGGTLIPIRSLTLVMVSMGAPCPPINSIMRLMTVWRIAGKIIRTAIFYTYARL